MKANRGEWSEIYVFFKILSERKIPAADKFLELITDKYFVFERILREETNTPLKQYDLTSNIIRILDDHNELIKTYDTAELTEQLPVILAALKASKSTTFELPEAQQLMSELLCSQVKASASKKSDLDAVIFDRVSNRSEALGFSIKSMLGGASTLLNAGKTTNFIYEVSDVSSQHIDEINAIDTKKSKIRNRIQRIHELGGRLTFSHMNSDTFAANLRKVDTVFPHIMGQMLLDFFHSRGTTIADLTTLLSENDALKRNYKLSYSDYVFKVNSFLIATALGMVPSKEWDGFTKAHGGYLIVKHNGDVICYHLYNRDEFLSYLFENTKLESASSTRHDYGKLYEADGKLFFNLNLQVRFIKYYD